MGLGISLQVVDPDYHQIKQHIILSTYSSILHQKRYVPVTKKHVFFSFLISVTNTPYLGSWFEGSFGHLVPSSFGPLVIWSFGPIGLAGHYSGENVVEESSSPGRGDRGMPTLG